MRALDGVRHPLKNNPIPIKRKKGVKQKAQASKAPKTRSPPKLTERKTGRIRSVFLASWDISTFHNP